MQLGALGPDARFGPSDEGPSLVIPREIADEAPERIQLTDPEGTPVGTVTITDTYPADDGMGISGDVAHTGEVSTRPFHNVYVPAINARAKHGSAAVVVPVRSALSEQDVERATTGAAGGQLLFVCLTGHGMPDGLSASALIRATRAATADLRSAHVIAVPLARHDGGALDESMLQQVLRSYAPEAEVVRPTGEGNYRESVREILRAENPQGTDRGAVVFFTGLSGSGKSTLATALLNHVAETGERKTTSLDGDVVRRNLSKGLTFSAEDRETNIRRIGWVAAEIARHGGMVVCSPIAPFDSTRRDVRRMAEGAGATFVLVHVATPLEECERRDRKGLYARARAGEIPEFTGISSPYEEPADAEVVVDTTGTDIATALAPVLAELHQRGVLTRSAD